MNSNDLKARIERLEQLVGDEDAHNLNELNIKVDSVVSRIPELHKLRVLVDSIPNIKNTTEFDIELLLTHFSKYKQLLDNVSPLLAMDISKLNTIPVDITNFTQNKEQIITLTESYMRNMVKSLVVVEKYIDFVNEQNRFCVDTNTKLLSLSQTLTQHQSNTY